MIDTPLTTILGRINDALEHRIAPALDSAVLRGQVLTVVELLNQLAGKIEYRRDLLGEDLERAQDATILLVEALDAAGVDVPADLRAAVEPFDAASAVGEQLLEARRRARGLVSDALELLEANRARVANADAVDVAVFGVLQQSVLRDMMLFRRQRFEVISQRDQED